MRNQVQRQLIYRVMWNDAVISANIAPLSMSRQLSIWQFTHEASRRGASLQGQSGVMLTLSSLIGRNTNAIRGLVHRNMGRGLIGWLIKVSRAVLFHCKPSTVRQIGHFVSRLRTLYRTQGEKGTTLYLKSCQVLLQQSIAGYKVHDISELKVRVRRTKSGLPQIIPAGVRDRIRKGDVQSIKLWMTLFGWYRICQFKGELKLSTITDPGKPISKSYLEKWELFVKKIFIPTLQLFIPSKYKVGLSLPQPFSILKSGPTTAEDRAMIRTVGNSSFYALVSAARTWVNHPLYPVLVRFLKTWHQDLPGKPFPAFLERIGWASGSPWSYFGSAGSWEMPKYKYLAKLGFKVEAAGKVRVFAMVDAWTQWTLRPIHDMIFGIIRYLPMDGTFDQVAPVEKLRSLPVAGRWFYSIDLSAATDRLPIALQVPLMSELLKWSGITEHRKMALDWAMLLVGREYQVKIPRDPDFIVPDNLPPAVTYSVGQPMGALSSWAMLAVTHHAIVQWAAHRAFHKGFKVPILFKDYAILGDDIVILNRAVALEYLRILDQIGVKAGLAKSIVCKGKFYLEFAKKFFVPSGRADMLPFKEAISVYSSTILTCEFVRKHNLTLGAILSFLGFGYRAKSRALQALYTSLPKRLRTLMVWFRSPVGAFPLDAMSWLQSSGFTSQWDVPDNWEGWVMMRVEILKIVRQLMTRYEDALDRYRRSIEVTGAIYDEEHYLKHGLLKDSPPNLRKLRIPLAKEGKLVRPLSQHPPYLTERTEVDPGTNSVFKSKISFKHLVAPIDWEVHDETQGGESLSWFLRLNMNYSHMSKSVDREPVQLLPKSARDRILLSKILKLTGQWDSRVAVAELLDWLFNFDKYAAEIPSNYWPQYRVMDKPTREFLMVTEWHEKFTRIFQIYGCSPRLKSEMGLSGNTPVTALVPVNQGAWASGSFDQSLVENPLVFTDALSALRDFRDSWPLPDRKNLEFNTYRPQLEGSKWLISLGSYLRDFIILASLVWLVPIWEPVEEVPQLVYNWFLLLPIVLSVLGLFYLWWWPSGSNIEASLYETLSRQAQTISQQEVRLIRQQCEAIDLNDIIDGLETALEESQNEIEALTHLLSELGPWR